jgi:hypothetical protein
MRKVVITGTPPQDWVDDAEAITTLLRAAAGTKERQAIIDANQTLWRDDRIRNWLLNQFHNKCWYSEAFDSASSIHVDHYRPKGRVKEELGGETCEGYWWLAFHWQNYKICGQLLNVKKGDLFPLAEGQRANANCTVSLRLESPVLIDPCSDETRLVSYELDEDGCVAVIAEGVDEQEKYKATQTIEILGLNKRDRLNKKRRLTWDECAEQILSYTAAQETQGAQALKQVAQAKVRQQLKKMIAYESEFSSIAQACIYKTAPQPLALAVLGG